MVGISAGHEAVRYKAAELTDDKANKGLFIYTLVRDNFCIVASKTRPKPKTAA